MCVCVFEVKVLLIVNTQSHFISHTSMCNTHHITLFKRIWRVELNIDLISKNNCIHQITTPPLLARRKATRAPCTDRPRPFCAPTCPTSNAPPSRSWPACDCATPS